MAQHPKPQQERPIEQRKFTDHAGELWFVRETIPSGRGAMGLPPAFSAGWLTFERRDGSQVRRLAPAPEGWRTCPAPELARLCERAAPSKVRTEASHAPFRRYVPEARDDAPGR